MKMGQDIGANIRDERKAKKLTQAQLAEKLGVAQTTVASWENGSRNISVSTLGRIAEALGVSVAQLSMDVVYHNGVFVKEDTYLKGERNSQILAAEMLSEQFLLAKLRDIPDDYFLTQIYDAFKKLNRINKYRAYKFVTELADSEQLFLQASMKESEDTD